MLVTSLECLSARSTYYTEILAEIFAEMPAEVADNYD